ncbi:MAG: DUF393 domain-containing protein [Parasphingorhabdus sp.]|uniref:thiol-disulfide oxidoreductase DCC family protein n=1 Tax=Parasphingorhabdus sp. TaxID=2709688 RepID=UPI003267AACD
MSKIIIWYDGGCPLCLREIAMVRRLDKNDAIDFVDLTSPNISCPLDRTFMLNRFHAQESGVLLSGAAAFAAMWRAVPLLRPLGLAARIPGVLSILETGYRLFLNVRPRLQRYAGGRVQS